MRLIRFFFLAAVILVLAAIVLERKDKLRLQALVASLEADLDRCTAEAAGDAPRAEPFAAKTLSAVPQQPSGTDPVPARNAKRAPVPETDEQDKRDDMHKALVEARISAVGRLIKLTEGQESELREKMLEPDGAAGMLDTLKEVIGAENTQFYLEARARAFQGAELREIEKETVYLSRKLGLDPIQEDRVRNAIIAVDEDLKDIADVQGGSPEQESRAQRLGRMLESARRERQLLQERLRPILTTEQFNAYLAEDAQSSEAEMEVWH